MPPPVSLAVCSAGRGVCGEGLSGHCCSLSCGPSPREPRLAGETAAHRLPRLHLAWTPRPPPWADVLTELPAPVSSQKSVRLVVNYLRTQKAVVRVSPEVPLHSLLPVICAKCDVSPEHVVLLRDNVAGEELELSKSLSELGIKELYAWDNKRETFRKSSFGSDETDKEKKKFLGFFKVNKRSNGKVEQGRLSADSDEDTGKLAPGRGSHGSLTTPNSPSMTSRSITLGPSLSLSNISGVSVKSDMKKRRAPPPPSLPGAGPPAQDKASEKWTAHADFCSAGAALAPVCLVTADVANVPVQSWLLRETDRRRRGRPCCVRIASFPQEKSLTGKQEMLGTRNPTDSVWRKEND
ncbi:protein cordon-bleu [Myotis lucifugus]|uniref:protein cordon-bleu n=1 Tax=Myotis lucifugus TaxID=59463 RepID=UPI000CCBF652|nr:protein cordon-bleu [Myotis lucifugus]